MACSITDGTNELIITIRRLVSKYSAQVVGTLLHVICDKWTWIDLMQSRPITIPGKRKYKIWNQNVFLRYEHCQNYDASAFLNFD